MSVPILRRPPDLAQRIGRVDVLRQKVTWEVLVGNLNKSRQPGTEKANGKGTT